MKDTIIEEIIEKIKNNSTLIIERITQEDIDVYNFIQKQFQNSNGDIKNNSLFKFAFKKYYFRYNERLFNPDFFQLYFSKFSDKKLQERIKTENNINVLIEKLLNALKPFREKLEFSYTTKMIHTINNKYPIYDSYVRNALGLKPPYQSDEKKRKEHYLNNFHKITEIYTYIIRNKSLRDVVNEFSIHRDISNLNDIKILDFIFWSTGK